MKKNDQDFLLILRSHLTGSSLALSDRPDWEALAELALRHSLQAMVYHTLRGRTDVPREVMSRLQAGFHATVFQDAQMDHTREQLAAQFTQEKLPHVFLRGICLKHSYPVPALRSMNDIDLLVLVEDYPALHRQMEGLGARFAGQDDNHRSYAMPNGVSVELHPNLLRHSSPGASINPGWQFVRDSDTYTRQLTPEGEYINTLCHMVQHLVTGGTGVRTVIDVWVLQNRKPEPDRETVENILETCGLLPIVQNLEALAQTWFGEGESTPLLEEMGEYILTGGTYGTVQRALLSSASLAGGKWTAFRKRVFPSRKMLEDTCPWSRNKPLLLPAAWTVRAWQKVTYQKGKLLKQWGKDGLQVEDAQVQAHKEMLCRFGLKLTK